MLNNGEWIRRYCIHHYIGLHFQGEPWNEANWVTFLVKFETCSSEAMQSGQLYYFTTISLQFQQTCLLNWVPALFPVSPLGRGETFLLPCRGSLRLSPIVLLHNIANWLWPSNDAVALWPHFRGQMSCNWDNSTWVKVTLLFLLPLFTIFFNFPSAFTVLTVLQKDTCN